jgi:hypothetical protein
MIAYKFLRTGRVGPFSNFNWPEPGIWVRAGAAPDRCRRGIHACRTRDLPWWLADELWEIELRGEVQGDPHKLAAAAGRLRSRVEQWTPTCAKQYGDACAWRAGERAVRVLTDAGHRQAADELAASTTLDELLVAARRLAEHVPDARIPLTIASDGAVRALSGAPATAAYIAAQAALRVGGPAGYAAERGWQSHWLSERLGLRASA